MLQPRSFVDGSGYTAHDGQVRPSKSFVQELLESSLILTEDWETLPVQTRDDLISCGEKESILSILVQNKLLTEYQANRIDAGKTFGLILGNYRVLDRIGAGGMGVVFRGEHVRLRNQVAIKVLPVHPDADDRVWLRFRREMRIVAQLQHPNIVRAVDEGEMAGCSSYDTALHFFVMEYVPGQDLEKLVQDHGPLSPARACGLVYQIASALAEAHKHGLVHRDIKPSNIQVSPDGQAKLLDFGLVRQGNDRLTEPGTVLGTLDYLAPEQAKDASTVDIRADIYSLGGTLFWCLTGKPPFPNEGTPYQNLLRRLDQAPPSVRTWKPEIADELNAVVVRMMACAPGERYPTPQAVMNGLLPFLHTESQENFHTAPSTGRSEPSRPASVHGEVANRLHRVLVVDDSSTIRKFCTYVLNEAGIPCDEAVDGTQALKALGSKVYDLVLTDWQMPGMTGLELCQKLRENPPLPNLKIILFSAEVTDDDVAQVLAAGADDYLSKRFSPVQLVARVKSALRLKDSQDRGDLLNRQLLTCNQELEKNLTARDSDLVQVRNALVLGLADLVSQRDVETVYHALRLQRYCRCLAEEAAHFPAFANQIDENFIQMLECCAPLHDIGKASLPDHVLMKSGQLDVEERIIMQTHTVIGAETLQNVARRHGSAMTFLQMAIDIARHHHERYDGKGYPDQLAGNAIPLSARILTIGDVYDGLRCRRPYKPALTHGAALQLMTGGSEGQFDPLLLQALTRCSFDEIFREMPG